MFYTPDEIHNKFKKTDISNVKITSHSRHGTKCFAICINNTKFQDEWFYTTTRRLAGSNRTSLANLQRSLRYSIEPQIKDFKDTNPLICDDLCPVITSIKLGEDAEVDHKIPFSKLADKWKLKNNIKISDIYNIIYPNNIINKHKIIFQ